MLRSDQFRSWRRMGLNSLLCLAMQGLAVADTSTPPTKTPQASTAPAVKAMRHAGGHAAISSHAVTKSRSPHGKKGSKYGSRKLAPQAHYSGRARQIQTQPIIATYIQWEPSGS